ncbi:hypothetical protein F5I97DRAFT_1872260 [Phlebopus sp. FC_14]|nr:hypothetical protein F5I97DRAFT_1872260 [Phlebopus sp. FC_14]
MFDIEEYTHGRRRSVDVGGLALALENRGLGHGWGGWDDVQQGETRYAELLSEMYTQTQTTVNHHTPDLSPIEIPTETRTRLIMAVDSWHFEPHKLPDEEVLFSAQILFESLFRIDGMQRDTGVSLAEISIFLKHLRHLYCGQNSYHNFHHALDVLQACQAFLCAAGIVPPASILCGDSASWKPDRTGKDGHLAFNLCNMDLFALFIAAIGHDVGHPGLTNMFMKNANAPLSAVFDGKSALEQMHYAILIQAMRHHGLGSLFDRPNDGAGFRKLLAGIVLATDMGVHFEFMKNFGMLVDGKDMPVSCKRLLFGQAIIKCADISNPSRPPGVSHYWANALMAEWSSQASLEKLWRLPPSVQPSECPLTQVSGQIFFISTFAKPLMDIVAKAVPELQQFADQCTLNLAMWEARRADLSSSKDLGDSERNSASSIHSAMHPPRLPEDFLVSFPLTLPTFALTPADEPPSVVDWNVYHPSSPSSSSSGTPSDAQLAEPPSPPVSPGSSSYIVSPGSPSFSHRGTANLSKNEAAAAMRAAYQAGVRKKPSFYNRYSWGAHRGSVPPMTDASVAAIPKAAIVMPKATVTSPYVISKTTTLNEASRESGTVQ